MSEPRRISSAIVEVVLKVDTDSWGDDCSMGQIARQAKESAIGKLRRAFEKGVGTQHVNLAQHDIEIVRIGEVRIVCVEQA